MGFEPTTSCLGSKHSTTELHPLVAAETSPNILQTAWNSKARHATLSPPRHPQDDCKVHSKALMVSLSNHERLGRASFDKLRMSGCQ